MNTMLAETVALLEGLSRRAADLAGALPATAQTTRPQQANRPARVLDKDLAPSLPFSIPPLCPSPPSRAPSSQCCQSSLSPPPPPPDAPFRPAC